MCGKLFAQKVLSGQMAQRDIFLRPPEPAPQLLVSPPGDSVYIGRTKYLRVPFFWNSRKLLNPHLCVVGTTGSGKSYFVKTFITRARLALGTPALILDWAGEYAGWVRLAGGSVVELGKDGINLLSLPGGQPHHRAQQVMSALSILTDISHFPPQCRLTEEAIERACRRKEATLETVRRILGRAKKRSQDASGAELRIRRLLQATGKSFCSPSILPSSLLSGLVCVDLHSLPTEELRSLAGLSILQFVKERMRASEYSSAQGAPPRLLLVVDEAWKIASDERSDVVSIVREGRKYGFALIVASQNPTDVHKSIFSNAGTMMLFRLTHAAERAYVRSSLAYSDFYEEESHSLAVGQSLVHLEFSQPAACPRTFILEKVEGEAPLQALFLRGGTMDIELEKGELASRLLAFGLSEAQAAALLSEFERRSFSLDAGQFISVLGRLGFSRASAISLLRELGASEKDLLFASRDGELSAELSRKGKRGQ